MLKLVSF